MGQSCFKPKSILKKQSGNIPILEKTKKDPDIIPYNYAETLTQVNDKIYEAYLNVPSNGDLIAKALPRNPISRNSDDEIPSKMPRSQYKKLELKEIQFFTDKYTIDDLEEFLSSCSSNSNFDYSPRNLDSDDEDSSKSLSDTVFLGTDKDVENLSDEDVKFLLINKKIHLDLAKNPEHVKKLTILLRKASFNKILSELIDVTNDDNNSAISIAALNLNIQAFYYLLMKCQADIPLLIFNQGEKTPFLIYLAQNGKIKTNKENEKIEYILLPVLKQLIDLHPREDLLKHLNTIDSKTKLSLPHFLLNIYSKTIDIRQQIIECFKLCIKEGPECADAMCINYYDPRFSYNVTANFISHPDIDVETVAEFMEHLKKSLAENDKILLRELIKVHQDKKRIDRLLQVIS